MEAMIPGAALPMTLWSACSCRISADSQDFHVPVLSALILEPLVLLGNNHCGVLAQEAAYHLQFTLAPSISLSCISQPSLNVDHVQHIVACTHCSHCSAWPYPSLHAAGRPIMMQRSSYFSITLQLFYSSTAASS